MLLRQSAGILSISGAIPLTERHVHHALQFSVARSGHVLLDGTAHDSVLLDADVPHRLQADDALTLLIDPESHSAQRLRATWLDGAQLRAGLLPRLSPHSSTHDVLHALIPEGTCADRHLDPRIEDVLSWMDQMQANNTWPEVTLAAAVKRACLSKSRFLHLFKAQTGIAWRPALVWRRARVASFYARHGTNLSGLRRLVFRGLVRHLMNRTVAALRHPSART